MESTQLCRKITSVTCCTARNDRHTVLSREKEFMPEIMCSLKSLRKKQCSSIRHSFYFLKLFWHSFCSKLKIRELDFIFYHNLIPDGKSYKQNIGSIEERCVVFVICAETRLFFIRFPDGVQQKAFLIL